MAEREQDLVREQGKSKADLRKEMMKRRSNLTEEQRDRWSDDACLRAASWMEKQHIESFMVYLAFRGELDLSRLIEWGWNTGRKVVAPRCNQADYSMSLHLLENWSQLERGAYGLLEPSLELTSRVPASEAPEAIFVPGLSFDLEGGRLGYGGGYYDRFAEAVNQFNPAEAKGPIWIGACFEAQLAEAVPSDSHDARMNGIVTEKQLYFI